MQQTIYWKPDVRYTNLSKKILHLSQQAVYAGMSRIEL